MFGIKTFNNENKITESELCDGLRSIIHNADINNKINTYTSLDIDMHGPEEYPTGNVFEKYTTNNTITFGYTLNKSDINTDISKTNYRIGNETKRSFSALDLESNVEKTKSVSISNKYDSDIDLTVSITDNTYTYNNTTIGGVTKTFTYPIHFYNKVFLHASKVYCYLLTDNNTREMYSALVKDNTEFTLTVNAGSEEYISLYIPESWKEPKIYVGGIAGGFYNLVLPDLNITRTISSSMTTIKYKMYTTPTKGLGKTTVTVKFDD